MIDHYAIRKKATLNYYYLNTKGMEAFNSPGPDAFAPYTLCQDLHNKAQAISAAVDGQVAPIAPQATTRLTNSPRSIGSDKCTRAITIRPPRPSQVLMKLQRAASVDPILSLPNLAPAKPGTAIIGPLASRTCPHFSLSQMTVQALGLKLCASFSKRCNDPVQSFTF